MKPIRILMFVCLLPVVLLALLLIAASAEAAPVLRLQTEKPDVARMLFTLAAEVGVLSSLIFAAVAWMKSAGVSGKWLTILSFAFGLVTGVGYRYAVAPMTTFLDWFLAVAFGLLCGFLPSGTYKGLEDATGAKTLKDMAKAQGAIDYDYMTRLEKYDPLTDEPGGMN